MDVSVVRSRVGRPARLRRTGGKHFALRCSFGRRIVLHGCEELRIHRLTSSESAKERDFVFLGVLLKKGVLSEQMTGNIVILSAENLFAVVARV